MLVCLTAARTFAPIAHLTREWTRNFTGSTPSTRLRSPPQGARAIDGKLRRDLRRQGPGAPPTSPRTGTERLLERPLHPLQQT